MSLKGVSPTADTSVPLKTSKMDAHLSLTLFTNPFTSKTLFKSRSLNKISKGNAVRRSCSLNLDSIFSDVPSNNRNNNNNNNKLHSATWNNNKSPFLGRKGRDQDPSRLDFLEPMMLGIRPDWPDHETSTWATIEQKAKSLDIPLSLRMIKKKLQLEEAGFNESDSGLCSVKAAFASTVLIIVELQSCALRMREELCHEDLEVIACKVQKEMHSSFVWLFQQVFSTTPVLMLHVMLLLANFGVHSILVDHEMIHSLLPSLAVENGDVEAGDLLQSLEKTGTYRDDRLGSVVEMDLWNSMVDDAANMRGFTMQHFVSPWSVELQPDTYDEYLRTDLVYQMNLSQEPHNPLLLCNYAQFLYLVARDYGRAEECFKRGMQIFPTDAECAAQYANFLWTVKKDYWAAEENYLRALNIDPKNPYFASRYASFLWHTGGEETCFSLNNPPDAL